MEIQKEVVCIILPTTEWQLLKDALAEISQKLNGPTVHSKSRTLVAPYITAKEFMSAVRICRSSFDKLVQKGKIKVLKKGRKWYVSSGEVERYFEEVEV